MPDKLFQFNSNADAMAIQAYVWHTGAPRAVVVLSHGAAEHALRYDRFARALNAAGLEVWATDHRGHGASAGPEGLGDFGPGGWDALVADIGQFVGLARAAHPNLPLALFGHSMGSSAARQYVPNGSHDIDALILSGAGARVPPPEGEPAAAIPGPNAAFEPGARTDYDWLSRDEAEVDKYIADPLCGFNMQRVRNPASRASLAVLGDPELHRKIRPDLPVLFVAGDKDPINRNLEGLHLLEQWWRDAGVRQIDTLYYEGGRHEMLNETNRDEVTADIVAWIARTLRIT